MTTRARLSDSGPAMANLQTELHPYLRAIGRRFRLRNSLLFISRTLWLGLVGALLLLLAGRIWPIPHWRIWAGLPLLTWLLVAIGYSVGHRLPPLLIARRADRMLHLQERLSTALEMAPHRAHDVLIARQWEDALAIARQIHPRRDIGLTIARTQLGWAGLFAATVLLLLWLPNPMDQVLLERAMVRQTLQQEANAIEQLRQELYEETTPTSETREELLRQLAQLAREMRANPGQKEKALADISRTEELLRQKLDPQSNMKRAALENLAAQLENLAAQKTGQQLETSQEALAQLAEALAALTPEEQAALAQQLEQLAGQIAPTDTDLAKALAAMANAARRGDTTAAEQAARSAQGALTNAQRDQDLQRAIARALAELQTSRATVAQAGQGRQNMAQVPNQAPGQQANQPLNQGQSGQGQGPPGGRGGGTNARQLPPGTGTGQARNPTGPPRSSDTDELDQVYAPRTPGEAGEIDFIQGQQLPEGQTTTKQDRQPLPAAAGQARIPYSQVLPAYREAAIAALEHEYIPPGLRDYVKAYFSHLEPQGQE